MTNTQASAGMRTISLLPEHELRLEVDYKHSIKVKVLTHSIRLQLDKSNKFCFILFDLSFLPV